MVAGKVTTVSVPCLFGGLDKKKINLAGDWK